MVLLQDIKNMCFQGYKSYKKFEDSFIPGICDFNVIIGKNNTGKTSFIDMLDFVINPQEFIQKYKVSPELQLLVPLDGDHIEAGFHKGMGGGHICCDHYVYGSRFIGSDLPLLFSGETVKTDPLFAENYEIQKYWQIVANSYKGAWRRYKVLRLSAERDICPEIENRNLVLQNNGVGASNLIRGFINQVGYDEHLIEDTLLEHLNYIMGNDASFSRIQIQQKLDEESATWEIFLEEKESGRFALSQSGSGLKTIILVLLNLLVIPHLPENKDKICIFAFEELENNLHPALQRRLFEYLYRFATNQHIPVFLTTHSHIAIDLFCSRPGAQVLHVTKENHQSSIKQAATFFDKKAILDDLCVKASDLFQSNGIIWVEGPSDRIYINQWLKVFCDSKYQEGKDFQYLYYGGRLLSHYSAEDIEHKINILTTNHNSAIVIDSDKKNARTDINTTKQRIAREFKNRKMFCWITEGKEIENYLPLEAINRLVANPLCRKCGKFQLFPNYIKAAYPNFVHNKVDFANKIVPHISVQNSENILDLKTQILALYKQIEEWNKK